MNVAEVLQRAMTAYSSGNLGQAELLYNRVLAADTKLTADRDTCPLFDIDRFRHHIEAAYATMRERHLRGEPPEDFTVAAIEDSTKRN